MRLEKVKGAIMQLLPEWFHDHPNADDKRFYDWLDNKYPRLIGELHFLMGVEPRPTIEAWVQEFRANFPDD